MMTQKPFISVIIPTYRDWARLNDCLHALALQDYPNDLCEIIIVNNDVEDAVPEPFLKPDNAVIVTEERPGSYAARNRGASLASGELLAFTDADCRPERTWLSCISDFYLKRGKMDCLMSGRVKMFSTSGGANPLNFAESYDYVFGINQELYVKKNVAATANLVIPNSIFAQLNGFEVDRMSGGDSDFCLRAHKKKIPLFYNQVASVRHPLRSDTQELIIKARRLVGGKLQKHRMIGALVTLAPPVVRLKILLFEKKAKPNIKMKALGCLLVLKLAQVHFMVKLFLGVRYERR